jgi:ssDNA-binding Zn-finger/Zn-ribbon topoisomerase 1
MFGVRSARRQNGNAFCQKFFDALGFGRCRDSTDQEKIAVANDPTQFKAPPVVVLGRLPDKQLNEEKARQKFAEFWQDPVVCPACKTEEWMFGQNLAHLFHLSDLATPVIEAYPVVHLVCKKCGYLMLFDATRLGLDNA